jgi:UDP-N-acetylglucosamine 2-epimerase (non-hydrolysing)
MADRTIMVAYGTRPEAVKVAPLVRALRRSAEFSPLVAVTGQHREMLDQVNDVFGIEPDVDLDIFEPGQSLGQVTTRTIAGVERVLGRWRPDAVVVQGDTSTTFAVGLAAFYARTPVVHLEAGLRTNDPASPFPEEINRRLTSQLTALHLAPTAQSRRNLLAENIDPAGVLVTGNTVIDALQWAVERRLPYGDPMLAALDATDRPMLLVTAHRRESWGAPLRAVGRALARIARTFTDLIVVLPVHRNPIVRRALLPPLAGLANVVVTEPVPYGGFCRLMDRAVLILTDSGGVQEEGPSLGKPVLVMRDTTERPEAVAAGTVRLVGTDEDTVVGAVTALLTDPELYQRMATAVNPYGDGQAARRGVQALAHYFGLGPRPDEFDPVPTVRIPAPPLPAVERQVP